MRKLTKAPLGFIALTLGLHFFLAGLAKLPAEAQTRALPKANFQNYTGGSDGPPVVGGLHLNEGTERKAGAPAGVYNPGEPSQGFKLVQWDKRRFPIKIWLSEGKKLMDIPFAQHKDQRPDEVYQMLQSPKSFDELAACAEWTMEMNYAVARGFEQWPNAYEQWSKGAPALGDAVIPFCFVGRPEEADVLVFWVDRFDGSDEPGGNSAHALTCAKLFWTNQVKTWEATNGKQFPHYPVVMEFQPNTELTKLQSEAAHEFGHALGIKAHSEFRNDIMYAYKVVHDLSPSDRLTLRWLYSQKPDMLME